MAKGPVQGVNGISLQLENPSTPSPLSLVIDF
jgi:hypothetical protein